MTAFAAFYIYFSKTTKEAEVNAKVLLDLQNNAFYFSQIIQIIHKKTDRLNIFNFIVQIIHIVLLAEEDMLNFTKYDCIFSILNFILIYIIHIILLLKEYHT